MHLLAGKLYIAQVTQDGAADAVGDSKKTGFTIKWILLGSTNQVGCNRQTSPHQLLCRFVQSASLHACVPSESAVSCKQLF